MHVRHYRKLGCMHRFYQDARFSSVDVKKTTATQTHRCCHCGLVRLQSSRPMCSSDLRSHLKAYFTRSLHPNTELFPYLPLNVVHMCTQKGPLTRVLHPNTAKRRSSPREDSHLNTSVAAELSVPVHRSYEILEEYSTTIRGRSFGQDERSCLRLGYKRRVL